MSANLKSVELLDVTGSTNSQGDTSFYRKGTIGHIKTVAQAKERTDERR
jgi:hypothetical protein